MRSVFPSLASLFKVDLITWVPRLNPTSDTDWPLKILFSAERKWASILPESLALSLVSLNTSLVSLAKSLANLIPIFILLKVTSSVSEFDLARILIRSSWSAYYRKFCWISSSDFDSQRKAKSGRFLTRQKSVNYSHAVDFRSSV